VFDYSGTERATIDGLLDPKLGLAKTRYAEAHQLALDATRLLSCTSDRLEEYKSKGFFKRAWYRLSGKTGDIQRANQADLLEAQKIGWRYLELLNERDLLQAQTIISIKNNLLTLATKEEETRRQVSRLADRVYDRFVRLEERVDRLEGASAIHSWLLTIETNDYDEKFPPHLRMLRVVNDFMSLKPGAWNMMDLKYLQKALMEVGVEGKRELSLEDFVNELIAEIESSSFQAFCSLLMREDGDSPPAAYVLENVVDPTYSALFEIASSYTTSAATIDVLREHLKIGRADAIRAVLKSFMNSQGINLSARMQLRMLAVEVLDCAHLARTLYSPVEKQAVEANSTEPTSRGNAPQAAGNRKAWSASPVEEESDTDPESEAARIWGTSLWPISFQTLEQRLSVCFALVSQHASEASCFTNVLAEIAAAQELCGLASSLAQAAQASGHVIEKPLRAVRERLFQLDSSAWGRLRSLELNSTRFLPIYWASCQVRLVLVAVDMCLGDLASAAYLLMEAHETTNRVVDKFMDLETGFDEKYDTINALLSADKLLVHFGQEAAAMGHGDVEGGNK
jgi:hypothetical protein